ncbi:MAG: hypothetical protein MH137_10165 [Flavobacteriales bacterium]|nr:hypothetical protein [Flavobacteriales bacterium]
MNKLMIIAVSCFTLFTGKLVLAQTPIFQKGQLTIPHNAEGPRDANGKLLGLSSDENKPLRNTFWYWKDASGNHIFCVLSSANGSAYQAKISDALAKSAPFKSTKIEIDKYSKAIEVILPENGFILTQFYESGYSEAQSKINFIDYGLNHRGTSTPNKFYWNTEYKEGKEMEWLQFVEKKVKAVFGLN